jgi:hypothetical protein
LKEQSISHLYSVLDELIPSELEVAGDLYQQIISTPLAFSDGKVLGLSKAEQSRVGGEFYTPRWVADIAFDYWSNSLRSSLDANSLCERQSSENVSPGEAMGGRDVRAPYVSHSTFAESSPCEQQSSKSDSPNKAMGGRDVRAPYVFHSTFAESSPCEQQSSKSVSPGEAMGGRDVRAPYKLSIYDPSCGSGNFLLAAVRNAKKRGLNDPEFISFVANAIHGTDIDGKAIELARALVLLQTWTLLDEAKSSFDANELHSSLSLNIKIQDSLLAGLSEQQMRKYDLVITNPPYISFGSRDQEALPSDWQRLLKTRFPASSEYKIRYSSIFQEIGLASTKQNGQAIFFVPDAFLTGGYYQKLRNHILTNTHIVSLTELPEKTMHGVSVGRWCLAQYNVTANTCIAPNRQAIETPPPPSSLHSEQESERATLATGAAKNGTSVTLRSFAHLDNPDEDSIPVEFELPMATLLSKDKNRFQLLFSKYDQEIIEACSELSFLSTLLQGRTGIRARAGQNSIICDHPKNSYHRPGIISGSELKPYTIHWSGHFIEVNAEKLFAGGFDKDVISNPKILVRQTGDSLIAAIDYAGLYHLNNVHSFSTIKKTSSARKTTITTSGEQPERICDKTLAQLVCLLNSSFYKFFYGLKTREQKMALAQIDIETVEHMPIPNDFLSEASELLTLAAQIKELTEANLMKAVGKKAEDHKLAISQKLSKVDKIIFDLFAITSSQRAHIEESTGTAHSRV